VNAEGAKADTEPKERRAATDTENFIVLNNTIYYLSTVRKIYEDNDEGPEGRRPRF
jgi:hypothetical protein